MITLIESIMLIIFAINFNEKLASYSQLTSITKIVNEIQGLNWHHGQQKKEMLVVEQNH